MGCTDRSDNECTSSWIDLIPRQGPKGVSGHARVPGGPDVKRLKMAKWKYTPKQSTILFMTTVMTIIILYDKVCLIWFFKCFFL